MEYDWPCTSHSYNTNIQKIIAGKILDFYIQNFHRAAGPLSLIYENHIIASWLAT